MDYYYTTFHLHQNRHFSIAELDTMIPFERQIYLTILEQKMAEEQRTLGNGAAPMINSGASFNG